MTREEAITVFKTFKDNPLFSDVHKAAFNIAINALEQKPCEDTISRADAVKVASGYCHPQNIAEELAKLPPVQPVSKWIPVTEKLPKADETVLVNLVPFPNCIKQIAISSMFNNKTWKIKATVDAWMPLPEPYEPQESEEYERQKQKCESCLIEKLTKEKWASAKDCKKCKHFTDTDEVHGYTPCGRCNADLNNFEPKQTDGTDINDGSIKVGDEVKYCMIKNCAVVTRISITNCADILAYDGDVWSNVELNELHKTGRQFPQIAEVLEQLRGDKNE